MNAQDIMDKLVDAERLVIDIKERTATIIDDLRTDNRALAMQVDKYRSKAQKLEKANEELQWKLDGYAKCVHCNGDGGKHTQLSSHGPDPQSWVDCECCNGEGWVKQ